MKIIFLYGPPAVGKLTVAEKLAEITGYKVFHSHHTTDFIKSIFGLGTSSSSRLKKSIRLHFLKEAMKEDVKGFILTSVYQKNLDDSYIKDIMEVVKSNKGEFCPVQLICDKKDLDKRVAGESRKRFDKATTKEQIENYMKKGDFFSVIPYMKSFIINNTCVSPSDSAQQIKDHFQL